ncbi:MAG: T9SS type A sorting domain-containing protein [bacterium]|nr:T9SS type A sorting domain-containing protein [bacterium]
MTIRSSVLIMLVVSLFASVAFAAPLSKAELSSISNRIANGETITPAEKDGFFNQTNISRPIGSTGVSHVDLTGGPDGFGYRYVDQASGAVYAWETPSGAATNVTFGDADDGNTNVPIGFTFSFYGTNYTSTYAHTNGFITFGAASTGWSGFSMSGSLPTTSVNFWTRDMHAGRGGTVVRYETLSSPTRFVITYDSLQIYSGSATANRISAQVILYADGGVKIQYRNIAGTAATTPGLVGIKNANGSINLPYGGTAGIGTAIYYYTLGQPSNPSPSHDATGIAINNCVLGWNAANGATMYDVYFGTDATPTILRSDDQAGTSFSIVENLSPLTDYYWQIVASNGASTNPGPIWHFTTAAGAAPNAPTAGAITGATTSSLTGSFVDNSEDETVFPLHTSLNGTDFVFAADLPAQAGTGSYALTLNGLAVNTHYWARVYATGPGGTSTGFAAANGWTLANTPDAPVVDNPTRGSLDVTPNNNGGDPNPDNTVYGIKEITTGMWVTTGGTLDIEGNAGWQTLATWGVVTVGGLDPLTTYTFVTQAKNGAGVVTGFSSTADGSTLESPGLLFEDFETGAFGWSVTNPDAGLTWALYNFAGNNWAGVPHYSYNVNGQLDYLNSPSFSMATVSSAELTFLQSYNIYPGYADSLRVEVSIDGGSTWPFVIWNDGGATMVTRTTSQSADDPVWRSAFLPPEAAHQSDVRIRFVSYNDYGDDDYIDSILVKVYETAAIGNNPNGEGSQQPFTFTPPADPQTGDLPPVVISFPEQTGANGNPGAVTVNVLHELPDHNLAEMPMANTIHRFWDIQASSENFENATLRLRFTLADLPAGIVDPLTAAPPIEAAYSIDGGNTWIRVAGTILDLGGGVYEMLITGLNHFSLWSLGNGGVLPVELSAFTAAVADRQVTLNWRTESETNNDFFRIYRSESADVRGELIGVVDGMGNNQTAHNYRFVDSRVVNGVTYYYRLADVDLNGIEALHPTIVDATPTANANGRIPTEYALEQNFPNPFNPTTAIRYAVKDAGLVSLKVFDVTGREVATLVNGHQPANSYEITFDAATLSTGVYFYQLRVNDYYSVRKMVVAK